MTKISEEELDTDIDFLGIKSLLVSMKYVKYAHMSLGIICMCNGGDLFGVRHNLVQINEKQLKCTPLICASNLILSVDEIIEK